MSNRNVSERQFFYIRHLKLCSIFLLSCLLLACSSASLKDSVQPPPASSAMPPASHGLLSDIARDIYQTHGTEYSGFRVLDNSHDGLYWRLALIDSAVSSLDIQTYLWYPDFSGKLILERAILAAERGVKVRLIVDDLILQGHDQFIANMQAHPSIEFRLFNPWEDRSSNINRVGEMLARMERLNTRMHDKLMIVDGHAAIVGGRNIGDHYFGLNETYNFHDTDLLGIGHIALQANDMFDQFWNSDWVVSASNLSTQPDAEIADAQWQAIQANSDAPELESFPRTTIDWTEQLTQYASELRIGKSRLIFDETTEEQIDQSVLSSMFNFFGLAQRELLIMNAYVIPADSGVDFLRDLGDKGVDVKILTNSLASHDVPAVNSHYEPWRDDFLKAGVELYEFRPDPAIKDTVVDIPGINSGFTGLHSKTAVVDRRYVFIGSMNLDPRSASINTEMGAFVDSPELAADMAEIIERNMTGANSWQVTLTDDGEVLWTNNEESIDRQPARDGMQRVMNLLMKLGPKDQF
jgi:cardiolipin synthase C